MIKLISLAALLSMTVFVGNAVAEAVPNPASTEQTEFRGKWPVTQSCGDRHWTNILKIKSATADEVRGSTNVGANSGKIVAGSVVGRKVTFKNTYIAVWAKREKYTEIWIGEMSADGKSITGKIKSNAPNDTGACTFSGSKS